MISRRQRWWIVGAILCVAMVVGLSLASESAIAALATGLFFIWLSCTAVWLTWRLWKWATYRVGVRLFTTYFLIGVLPLLFAGAFVAIGLYVLMGQYTSVRIGSEFRRFDWGLQESCEEVLETAEQYGLEAAERVLSDLVADPPDPLTRVLWYARLGDREVDFSAEIALPDFAWLPEESSEFVARLGATTYVVTALRAPSGDLVIALLPFDKVTAADISAQWWFDVSFFSMENGESLNGEDHSGENAANISSDGTVNVSVDGHELTAETMWPEWDRGDGSFFGRPWVLWFRVVVDVVDMETGLDLEDASVLALLRTSPKQVWRDFTLSRYELASELWGALAGLGLFFLIGYGIAMATAATLIASISRSTTRLSQGAREVERGNLDYRISVKRRDQLGDLGRSFNHMTESVQSMLADVAEKERLAKELELAREIQESLLPKKHLDLGPVTIRATFQPATEVGGDYFDVFPLSDDRLIVAVGDVAGHGLSTGLLMASLKSSVAALVYEGYSGVDLISKVNRLLMEHGQTRTMVTLSVIEIDAVRGTIRVSNAGHPPAYLMSSDGAIDELMLGSIPMGNGLCRPVSLERPFVPGSRMLVYSDGLVEALSEAGEVFGFERLEELLKSLPEGDDGGLIEAIMASLNEWVGSAPLADDLTLLVIERTS